MTDTATAAGATAPETRSFEAETNQVLKLVIHSLYSHKEIFLRELISNASDACEKLRFESLRDASLIGSDTLGVELIPDAAAGTLTIRDNGIGMNREEVIENLGTIARSGTRKFLEALSGDGAKDAQLIGQFGVGFYSAFIVADKVTMLTKKTGSPGVRWDSDGEGSYEISEHHKDSRGSEVILHLREDDREFLDAERLRTLVTKYSDHLALPVSLVKDGKAETLNQAKAFWMRPKSELTPEEYQAFYKHFTHDWDEALAWSHNKVEGNLEYTSLLYVPKRAPFDMFNREEQRGVQLYVKRVFIMDKAAELLPPYLRFMRGLVDTADLPLNVSRELLQNNRTVDKIKAALVKRSLDLLDDLAANKPDDYATFWKTFGSVLKEGVIDDENNRERVAKLLRFASTHDSEGEKVTLADYISRMKEGQTEIYYATGDTVAAAKNSPHLEALGGRGFEVLLLTDRIDEWLVSHLTEFDGKKLVSAARAKLEESAIETPEKAATEAEFRDTLERLKTLLAGKVMDVKLSTRLVDSPAALSSGEFGPSLRMGRMLKAAGQQSFAMPPTLEINPKHPLVERLKDTTDDTAFASLGFLLHDQAMLADGGQLDDPASFVKGINKLLLEGAQEKSKILLV